ncbi:MAG: RNA-binding domain-containing protein [Candidatus Omnitrophota bacterium]
MKTKNVSKIIRTSESMMVEWKPSLSQIEEVIKSVAAFADTKGGSLFIGVSKDGRPMGVSIGEDPQRFFVQAKIRAGRFERTGGHDFHDYL